MGPHKLSGTVTESLHGVAEAFAINVGRVAFAGTDADTIPNGVTDWTYFNGALLVTLVRDVGGTLANGSAIMIAPGLAVTATHTVSDYLNKWTAGEAPIICVGPTPSGLVIWRVVSVRVHPGIIRVGCCGWMELTAEALTGFLGALHIVELIAATTTKTGLKIYAEADLDFYPTGVKITDADLQALPINAHDDWNPAWNYTDNPTTTLAP